MRAESPRTSVSRSSSVASSSASSSSTSATFGWRNLSAMAPVSSATKPMNDSDRLQRLAWPGLLNDDGGDHQRRRDEHRQLKALSDPLAALIHAACVRQAL